MFGNKKKDTGLRLPNLKKEEIKSIIEQNESLK